MAQQLSRYPDPALEQSLRAPAEVSAAETPETAEAPHPSVLGQAREVQALVQRRGGDRTEHEKPDTVREIAREGLRGPAQPLPHLGQIQQSFGSHDLSDVQAHTDPAAVQASAEIGAAAYTMGPQVAFRGPPDLHTAAHEAAHVVQQRAGISLQGGVGQPGDAYEKQADAVADKVVRGESAEALLASSAPADAGPAGVQMEPEEAPEGPLDERRLRKAIAYDEGRGMPPAAWAQVAAVVGSSATELGPELVQRLAAWQASKGLDDDGMSGDITTQWLSQHSGGEGLEQYVRSDDVVYMGINPKSRGVELERLKRAAGGKKVTGVTGKKKQDTADVDGGSVDLTTDDGLAKFAESLSRLDEGKRDKVIAFLERAAEDSRDELAQLVQVFYGAETGKRLIKRVILSGHSGGWSISGEPGNDTYVSFSQLAALPAIFPMACGQVEDIMLSACNTGQRRKLSQFQSIFPKLRSIWAYVGYSPSAATGSLRHIAEWEKASRGTINAAQMDLGRETIAEGTGKRDQNVAVWTKDAGGKEAYETASPEAGLDYETLRGVVDTNLVHFNAAYNDGNINQAELNNLYTYLQNLVGNFAYRLGSDAESFERIMKQTLYLRHWHKVTVKFMEGFGEQVKAGYGEHRMPAYAGVARSEVLGHINSYPGTAGDAAHQLLTSYLRDLNPELIPDTWY
jgi:hypothetical protein